LTAAVTWLAARAAGTLLLSLPWSPACQSRWWLCISDATLAPGVPCLGAAAAA